MAAATAIPTTGRRRNCRAFAANPYANGTEVSFRIVRPVGVLACEGRGRGGHAEGDCRFEPRRGLFRGLAHARRERDG